MRRWRGAAWWPGPVRRARITDRLAAAGLLAWAIPDVPWWWRPYGHGAATPAVLGYLALALAQSLPSSRRPRPARTGSGPGAAAGPGWRRAS